MTQPSPFRYFRTSLEIRYFRTSPEIIRLAAIMYIRFPLSLCSVEGLLHKREMEVRRESVRSWLQSLDGLVRQTRPCAVNARLVGISMHSSWL